MNQVSVIVPTHRRPHLLREAIRSVQGQSLRPLELIVVDDADDPDTREIVLQCAADASLPIRYIANDRGGVCWSRNLGGHASSGGVLAFLDDDDLWRPDFLLRLKERLDDAGADLALSGLLRHERGMSPRPRVQRPDLNSWNVLHQPGSMTGSNFLIRRDMFFAVHGFDPSIPVFNDWDLFVRLLDHGARYVVVEEVLADWREHEGERIATPSLDRAEGIATFLRRYRERLSPELFRDMKTMELGIRRARATSLASRLLLSVQLARAHGAKRTVDRIARRFAGGA